MAAPMSEDDKLTKNSKNSNEINTASSLDKRNGMEACLRFVALLIFLFRLVVGRYGRASRKSRRLNEQLEDYILISEGFYLPKTNKPIVYGVPLAAFLFGAASLSVLLGFGVSLYNARRRDPLFFKKMKLDEVAPETGSVLATKALAVATVLSVSSFGLMIFGVFKLFGVNDFHGFHAKMREYFPQKESKGKVDFKTLKELADYLISEDRKAELAKKKSAKDQS